MKGKKINWFGEVILPFIEGNRIKNAVRSRIGQMTPKEVNKNTEKHTLLFMNKNLLESDPIIKEEVRNFKFVEKLLLTKEIFYIHEKKTKNSQKNTQE